MAMWYPIAIEPGSADTAFGVVVPDIPGCYSAGETLDEAILNAREAIEGHLELACEQGVELAQATNIDQYINNSDFAGWVWALVDVDITPFLGGSQKVNVTLPEVLLKRIDDTVARKPAYKSRSGFLAQAALHELNKSSAA